MDSISINPARSYELAIRHLESYLRHPNPKKQHYFRKNMNIIACTRDFEIKLSQTLASDRPRYYYFFQQLICSQDFADWVSDLIKRHQFKTLSKWSYFTHRHFDRDDYVFAALNYYAPIFSEQKIELFHQLVQAHYNNVRTLLFWGTNADGLWLSPEHWLGTFTEIAVSLGALQKRDSELQENAALCLLLEWHYARQQSGLPGIAYWSVRSPIFHYAIAVGNISALKGLLPAFPYPLLHNGFGHTFFDLLIAAPNMADKYEQVQDLMDFICQSAMIDMLFDAVVHKDHHGIASWERLEKKLYQAMLAQEMSDRELKYYSMLHHYMRQAIFHRCKIAAGAEKQHDMPFNLSDIHLWTAEQVFELQTAGFNLINFLLYSPSAADFINDIHLFFVSMLDDKEGCQVLEALFKYQDCFGIEMWQHIEYQLSCLKRDAAPQSKYQLFKMLQSYRIQSGLKEILHKEHPDVPLPEGIRFERLPQHLYVQAQEESELVLPRSPQPLLTSSQALDLLVAPTPKKRKSFSST